MSEVNPKRQLMIAKQQLDKLSLFICSLADFYRGVSPTVDARLNEIQKLLKGKPEYGAAAELSSNLKNLLNEESKQLRQQRLSSLAQIERSLKKLQEVSSVDNETRAQIKTLLNALPSASDQTALPMSMFEQALGLFKQALVNNANSAGSRFESIASTAKSISHSTSLPDANGTAGIESELHQRIAIELRELLSPYLNVKSPGNVVLELNQQLEKGLTPAQLLECCLTLIRFMIRDVVKEADTANKLIGNIHKSLLKVNHGIKTTIKSSRERSAKRLKQNESMKAQISAIELAISGTSEIDELKQQTQVYLDDLQASIQQSEDDDKAEQTKMLALLQSMQKRLNELEKQAVDYQQKLAQQQQAAKTDKLTKLPNRVAYEDYIAEIKQSQKTDVIVAVIDIDHFKSINDKYGHSVGDKTLQVIAEQLQKNLSDKDFVCRWGGEEFVALLPGCNLTQAAESLEKLRLKISKLPFMFKGNRVSITVSIGLASLTVQSIDQAFEEADQYLYKAKQNGRNQIQFKGTE